MTAATDPAHPARSSARVPNRLIVGDGTLVHRHVPLGAVAQDRTWSGRALTALAVVAVVAVLGSGLPRVAVAQEPGAEPEAGGSATATCPSPDPSIRELAERGGRSFGAAYRPAYAAADPCYESTAVGAFSTLTPELATFPNAVAPEPGRFDLGPADEVCDLAEAHGLGCQAHALLWDPYEHPEWGIVPTWIRDLPPAERRTLAVDLVTEVVGHLRGRVSHVTVANEVFDADGSIRPVAWNTTGDDTFLFEAFRAARLADPGAVLLYNDYDAEAINPKSDAILDLARRLRATTVTVTIDGVEQERPLIDGVGFQAHLGTEPGLSPEPAAIAENLARFAAVGLTVRITELDVRVPVVNGIATPADVERQATLYRDVAAACLSLPACDGITLWGVSDAQSWITEHPAVFTGLGAALPLDAAHLPKPAWDALRDAFAAAVPASPGTAATPSATEADRETVPPGDEPAPPAAEAEDPGDPSRGRSRAWPLAATAAVVVAGALGLRRSRRLRRTARGGDQG